VSDFKNGAQLVAALAVKISFSYLPVDLIANTTDQNRINRAMFLKGYDFVL
jgi:hypothetical protein